MVGMSDEDRTRAVQVSFVVSTEMGDVGAVVDGDDLKPYI